MMSKGRQLGVALLLSVVSTPMVAVADEGILVEPLNSDLIPIFGTAAAQTIYQVNSVPRPETSCGNPGGSATTLVPCYEFAMTYVTYPNGGGQDQVVHSPVCNSVPSLDLGCETSVNLCAGNLSLDPFQIQAPVCGELSAEVILLTPPEPLTLGAQPRGTWDGVAQSSLGQVFMNARANGQVSGKTFQLPVIRIPASDVGGGQSALAVVNGEHSNLAGTFFDFGFFNVLNRVFINEQGYADIVNLIAEPLIVSP